MAEEQQVENAGPDKVYRRHLAEGRIMIQQCDSCSKHFFPPRVMCPFCNATDFAWREASRKGEIYSASVVRRKPDRGGDYSIVLVNLDEGVRMMSQVTDIAPDAAKIGQRVTLEIGELGEEHAVVLTAGEGGDK